ncbi:uncharacterized protein FIESC28_01095 [Fusarium coffeatum]|uniref:Xylanolytic transcriptional activator regulatory domain-containing protein n=1 Tax=Fusarium coffeatum TaxID=231269 RepID=A0A366S9S1_9HYPO|nr:uncharacterized protein FIESC28_01095 [Fusarium coffeatum]RBR26067.1 hypothetical protein FIESC28_01095 [Fusarium coffeatum]
MYQPDLGPLGQRYEQLQQREATYAELFELLRVMSEPDAIEVHRRIRAGEDVASIVSKVKNGHLLIQLSLAAETRRQYEFPYSLSMPVHLSMADNPYMDSLLYQATLAQPTIRNGVLDDNGQAQDVNDDNTIARQQSSQTYNKHSSIDKQNYHITYLVPYHAAQMVEPIVDKLGTTPWTRVISDNQLFRQLICSYFYYPHPCGPFAHKDLFFEDMATGRTDFCSPLLVNAVLSIASQSVLEIPNRSKIWLPDSLTCRFMAEARRLWDIESSKESSITTIQAALILSYTTTNNGMDEIGAFYAKRACEMGKDLDLFGPDKHGKDTRLGKARLFTAWGIFSWQALFDYSFFRPPYLEHPPQASLPNPTVEPQWYGEVWIQYPHNPTLDPLHVGCKLQTEAALHAIMNELGAVLFRKPSRSLTLGEIAVFKQKLNDWKNTLPEPLQPKKLVFPLHLTLHVQYHQLVIAFTEVIIKSEYAGSPDILHLHAGKAPMTVLNEAKIMLETVIRLYYARHDFNFYDPWVAFALIAIGNMVIGDLAAASSHDPDIASGYRSTLVLAAQGLNKQGLNYHISRLLAIQLQKAMDPKDLQLVQTHTTAAYIGEDEQALIVEHSHSHWPIPGMARIDEDPEKKRLKNLIVGVDDLQI